MTFNLGTRSCLQLRTCDARLDRVVSEAILYVSLDFTVICGHRSCEEQQELFSRGLTKLDGVTYMSKHNFEPSLAVDLAPWPIDWSDHSRFYVLAGAILSIANRLDISLRWGGDWDGDGVSKDHTFLDLPHFELADQ